MANRLTAIDRVRAERDRFVAFAFASAEVLLELDPEYRIRYAAGATRAMFGRGEGALVGKELRDLLVPEDHDRIRIAVEATPPGGRMPPMTIALRGDSARPLVVLGYRLPTRADSYYLSLNFERRSLTPPPPPSEHRDEATGLFEKEAFGEIVSDRIGAAKAAGKSYELTLFDLAELEGLEESIGAQPVQSAISHIGDTLRASSVDGDTAGSFDEGAYGLLHDRTVDIEVLRAQLSEIIRRLDPKGVGVHVSAATVDVQNTESSPEDTAKAVVYTINKFSDSQGDDFTISSLSQGYDAMVRETISQISEFKHIIRDGNFQVALQPIVDLVTGQPHHYEALARFDEKIDSSPFRLISFAEEVGVIGEFDLAMARRAIDMLVRAQNGGRDLSIAINLSGRSLSSPSFIETLLGMLRDYGSIRRNLWLEITESARICDLEATNVLIQNLRNAGHIVCLDDFGAGAAAFQYLRAMEVDVVKIDGVYVREALTAPHGRAFLKAMASLCKDLEIGVIAEMVEDKETAQFLRECGIRYGQGYLFGKPTFEITPGLQKAHNRLGRPERFHSAPAPKIAR